MFLASFEKDPETRVETSGQVFFFLLVLKMFVWIVASLSKNVPCLHLRFSPCSHLSCSYCSNLLCLLSIPHFYIIYLLFLILFWTGWMVWAVKTSRFGFDDNRKEKKNCVPDKHDNHVLPVLLIPEFQCKFFFLLYGRFFSFLTCFLLALDPSLFILSSILSNSWFLLHSFFIEADLITRIWIT